jgi:hypothetical protein
MKHAVKKWGLFICCLAVVGLQIPGRLQWAAAAFGLVVAAMVIWDRGGLRQLAAFRFWTIAVVITLLASVLLARPTGRFGPVPYSISGLRAATRLLFRAAALFGVAVVASRHLSHRRVARIFGHLGMRRLGGALGLAVNITPVLAEEAREARTVLKLRRGGLGPGRLARLELLIVTLLVRAARLAREAAFLEELQTDGPQKRRSVSTGGEGVP